jgi:hypothetical protein
MTGHIAVMPPLDRSEISPGIVARLDTDVLRAEGGSLTNAQVSDTEDRAVRGVCDFLVVAVDPGTDSVLALPLYPKSAPGSAPLDPARKSGPAEWLAEPVFYSRWQHWRIPLDALAAASVGETSAASARRTYSSWHADTLQELANWASRNRCEFRPA